MIVKIQYNPDSGNMRITTRPSKSIGDIKIVKKATQEVIDELDGRMFAYFIASTTDNNLRIYCETKPVKEW